MAERLQKILASAGLGSRRACEQWIKDRRVSVDGVVVSELGTKAEPGVNKIAVDGRPIPAVPKRSQYIALNKPRGYACTLSDPHAVHIVTELVDLPDRPMLRPVGRLDIESEGLLFLTDDGDFLNHMTHPRYHVAKTYLATVRGRPDDEALAQLAAGVVLEDGKTAPAERVHFVRYFPANDTSDVELVIHEGRNRQVRRMFAAVGHNVLRLIRTRIGGVTTRAIPSGTWRHLTPAEVARLMSPSGSPGLVASPKGEAMRSSYRPGNERATSGEATPSRPSSAPARPHLAKAAPGVEGPARPRPPRAAPRSDAPARPSKGAPRADGPSRPAPRRGAKSEIDSKSRPVPPSQLAARRYGKNTRRQIKNAESQRNDRNK